MGEGTAPKEVALPDFGGRAKAGERPHPRDFYQERRSLVERRLLQPMKKDIKNYPDGAVIEVGSTVIKIPEHLRTTNPHKRRGDVETVSIYIGGLPHNSSTADFAGDANEIKLAGAALLTGEADVVMALKPKGLTTQAYKEIRDGKTGDSGQRRVAAAAVEVIQRRLAELQQQIAEGQPQKPYVFRLIGYSEGFSQAASMAVLIEQIGLGKVEELVSIEGTGITGALQQKEIPAIPLWRLIKQGRTEGKIPKQKLPFTDATGQRQAVIEEGNDMRLSTEVFQELEENLGRGQKDFISGLRNLAMVVVNLARRNIPSERIRAVFTRNPDIEKAITALHIPLTALVGENDEFSAYTQVMHRLNKFRTQGADIAVVSGKWNHATPMENPSGIAYLMETHQSRRGRKLAGPPFRQTNPPPTTNP